MITAQLTWLVETDAHEGPVFVAGEDALYFTTQRPDVEIRRLDLTTGEVEVVRADASVANGMALGADGRLVVCEQHPAAIAAVDRFTGARETLVDAFEGAPLNSPNDVVVRSDGSVWFTDPAYGFLQGFRPRPHQPDAVYRWSGGALTCVATAFDKPNGLAFSPDESVLYVGDSGDPRHVVAFDVTGDGLGRGRVFGAIAPGYPDGLKVDARGRVYVSFADGVQVLDSDGKRIGTIGLPGAVNFCFGRDERVLFITTDDAIWAAELS
jgi:gluconolactonase